MNNALISFGITLLLVLLVVIGIVYTPSILVIILGIITFSLIFGVLWFWVHEIIEDFQKSR